MKITDLANKLGFTNDQLIELLLEEGIKKTNPSENLTDNEEYKILRKYNESELKVGNDNNSSLKSIKINGLFNKYDYEFKFNKDVNILVAENGSGKTTILNIITAVLNGAKNDINRLEKMFFKSITIENNKGEREVVEINSLINKDFNIRDYKKVLFRLRDLLPASLYRKIRIELERDEYIDLSNIMRYLEFSGYSRKEIFMIRDELEYIKVRGEKGTKAVRKSIENINKLIEEPIIYFPTYRRIEEELENIIPTNSLDTDNFKYSIKNNNKINFGITDVEMILNDLSTQLKDGAAEYYKKMTAEILDDLLCNKVHVNDEEKKSVDRKKINIVIGRIGEEKINFIDKLKEFINGSLQVEYSDFLYYYINKLIKLYELQKAIDDKIIKFKDVCNKYLLHKEIRYNEAMASINIYDNESKEDKTIPWNMLSSGEKQIVSFFARLYLNTTKPSIVVIDEPELSLSIFWQKTLLEDIYDSGKVALMIVTTHSPFIYKNRFSNFVSDLDLHKTRVGE